MSITALIGKIQKLSNPTVAGLDPLLSYIPDFIKERAFQNHGKTLAAAGEAIWEFNRALIDALWDIVPAVKPQSAYYEMYGIPGLLALEKTIDYARAKGLYVILDVKRGDIGSTAAAYSAAYIGETEIGGERSRAFSPDGITVSPYLGTDGLQPFVFDANLHQKSVFILVKTSNPSSVELQDLAAPEQPLYEQTAKLVAEISTQSIGKLGYSNVGCVVGATYPKQAKRLREMMPYCYFLVPGYGAQGGSADNAAVCFKKDGLGAIVNSSRAIMCAYKKQGLGEGAFAEAARAEAERMRDELMAAIERK